MESADKTLFAAQREFFNTGQTLSLSFRMDQIKKLKILLDKHQNEIIEALCIDLHKCETESLLTEILLIVREIDFVLRHLKQWMKPSRVSTPMPLQPGRSFIHHVPYGRVLIIAPWNYPVMLCLSPLLGAMAAGNCVVVKPSPLAKATEQLMVKLIAAYFDEKYITVMTGGPDIMSDLLQEQWDYIFFTGSPSVGKIVMSAAASHLTPITLELGGKSPCIVDEGADLIYAAKRIIWAKMLNAGQSCIAPDYLYVQVNCKKKLIEQMQRMIRQFYGENPFDSHSFGRIIHPHHLSRIKNIFQKGKVIYGGEIKEKELYVSPTLLDEVTWDDAIMQEEIFAPILPILTYEHIKEVIAMIKKQPPSLALYLFTGRQDNEKEILTSLAFGNACINECLLQMVNLSLPFGGVGRSGMGRYHGKYSFDHFSYSKSIYKRTLLIDVPFVYPPYNLKKVRAIKILLTPRRYVQELIQLYFQKIKIFFNKSRLFGKFR